MFPKPDFIVANDVRMAVYETGQGPAVVLVHGFPELAYSWRHQLPALAAAGYRAIAPDMRGYGLTGAPPGIENYGMDSLIGDLEGLLDSLGLERAIFVGHDWGALILWHMAMVAPARIEKLIVLNIPHHPRPARDPIEILRERYGNDYYIVNFQDSDEADRAFAENPAHFFDVMMRKRQITRAEFDRLPADMKSMSLLKVMARKASGGEALLTAEERDYFASAFEKTGFSNPINWYRNWTKNWQSLDGVDEVIDIPTLFIGAADDVVILPEHIEAMKPLVTNLTLKMLEPCGHWTQQERPDDVNRLMLDWLSAQSTANVA